ncbi:MAG TPA: diphosphate--fructose-6-phosphate 1-phosphotransferase, partial [Gammaproteobacteria bacterium]|nr:diphosphate--fructose-6-phosphate 1-phosphotransferase [Gammaproteobacteria bacterium]
MKNRNVLYAQSGGVTSVINATAAGVLEAGRKSKRIGKIFAAKNG